MCVAGVRVDTASCWIRLYPVTFRELGLTHRFSKYQLVGLRVFRSGSDRRPESFKPNLASVQLGEEVDTDNGSWRRRWMYLRELAGATTTCAPYRLKYQYLCESERCPGRHEQSLIDWEAGEAARSWQKNYPESELPRRLRERRHPIRRLGKPERLAGRSIRLLAVRVPQRRKGHARTGRSALAARCAMRTDATLLPAGLRG